jgi:hypothetical protein
MAVVRLASGILRDDRLAPLDDRHDVGEVVGVKQRETLAVVEFAVEVDSFDGEVEVFEETEELRKDATGGVAVFETAHRQCVAFVAHPRVESRVGVEGGGSVFGFGVIEAISFVFITVVGPQVEVYDDLHLLREKPKHIPLKQEIADGSGGVEVHWLSP